ncbi:PREDICTED: disease resistance protein RPM1-like [Ipomoea nil]|uniref:disease resistance protein RPM1-like n=1 Tax=Ipomoea nil TaxID=35883 RepID=UPI0009010E33|nr:PREDICTED: disease resistance protein RPM1-like [Ipomoea nil]XP_019186797.1 PREDICTED: disease resistance protein RPM1-like [Ipomoea nil]XP_019186805.1 PREDICTED: disease resistance protein RPM1-like [Ipomoea nil]
MNVCMGDYLIEFILENVTLLLEEKVNLLKGVKEEVEYIRDELERMIAFLGVADSMEEKDAELKVWVKQVRDAAYEIEETLDQFVLHQTNICAQYQPFNFLARLCLKISKLRARLAIASKVQSLKSRVSNISERHQRYRFKFNVPDQGSSLTPANSFATDCRGDALLLEECELVGIDGRKRQVIGWLLEVGSGLKVVSIVGMGGLGKSTLAKKVYDDATVRKHFHSHAWITVSESFKIEDVLKDLVQQLFDEVKKSLPEGLNTMNAIRLKEVAKEFLLGRRYIIVFDDVWAIAVWQSIQLALPNENDGSRVILTTRINDVGSYSILESNGYKYELKPLTEEESWTLFSRKTFQESATACPSHLEEISKNILKKCGGLPLAIVAISGVLTSKNKNNIEEWQVFNRHLGFELEANDRLESIRVILQISFKELPFYLKPCLLYMSIFPENHLIEHNTLIRLWIAEGFVKEREGRTLEEVADGYLNELINRSLIRAIQSNDDGSLKLGHIHDFYREIAVSKSRDHNFVSTVNEHITTWPNKARCLSVHGTFGGVPNKRYVARLRSLLTFDVIDSQSTSCAVQLLSSCKMVKVLDLRGVPLEIFPKEILKLLHLRYLSLRSTGIKMIPRSIKNLQNLEILDLKQTLVTELPVEILKLQFIRQLLVYYHGQYSYPSFEPFEHLHGFKAPVGIGGLSRLQKLSFIELNHGSGIIREIGMMTDLRRLSITKLRREDSETLCSSIEKLRSLSIRSLEGCEILDLSFMSSPPRFLQRLYLKGCLQKVPHWVPTLKGLVKVYFQWSHLMENPLEYLQDLPNLVHIEFLRCYVGETLCFKAGKFEKLRLLDLDRLEGLRSVTMEVGSVPLLEKLVVRRCNSLERVPAGIERQVNMKFLEFIDMPEDFVETFLPDRRGLDHCRIAHIPEVYYAYWKEGRWMVYSLEDTQVKEDCNKSAMNTYEQRKWL